MARLEKDKQKARNDMDRTTALFILFIIIFATTFGIYAAIKYKIEEIEQQCHELKTAIKDCEYYVLKSLSAMKNAKDKNTEMTLDELFDRLNTDSIVISFDKYELQERFNHIIWGSELIITRNED